MVVRIVDERVDAKVEESNEAVKDDEEGNSDLKYEEANDEWMFVGEGHRTD